MPSPWIPDHDAETALRDFTARLRRRRSRWSIPNREFSSEETLRVLIGIVGFFVGIVFAVIARSL